MIEVHYVHLYIFRPWFGASLTRIYGEADADAVGEAFLKRHVGHFHWDMYFPPRDYKIPSASFYERVSWLGARVIKVD